MPGIADRVAPLFGPLAPAAFEGLVTAVINELAAGPARDQALLMLDDYHPITAPAGTRVGGFPGGAPAVGAVRRAGQSRDPPLALARLRGRGRLTEVRDAELRFTAGEAAAHAAVTAAAGVRPGPLPKRSRRWPNVPKDGPPGCSWPRLSLRGRADVAGFVAAFTGSHRYVLDYLAEEVLEQQGEQVRAFLLETSVLERLSGALCDAVTDRTGSQALLDRVERAGLFLIPLDEVRGWWRYHHLFADLLRARLREEQPGRAAQLHRNAAAWCEEHGLADDAMRHAMAAGEMPGLPG